MTTPEITPFSRVRIRVAAAVFCGAEIPLIRRDRPGAPTHYTLPGGNVDPAEGLEEALARELVEELALDLHHASAPELLWVADQRVSRPGPTPPPRKLHLTYRLHIAPDVRPHLADTEVDEQPDGSHEIGVVEWADYRSVGQLPVFPPAVAAALAELPSPHASPVSAGLSAVTDANYTWV